MATTTELTTPQTESPPPPEESSWCPNCGMSMPDGVRHMKDAQARIAELESQVKVLTLRATSAVERANEYEATLRRFNNATPKHPSTAGSELEPRGRLPVTKLPSQGAGTHQSTQPTPIRSQFARLLARSTSSASAPPSTAPLDRPKGVSLPQGLVGAQAVPATAGLCQSDTSLLDALAQEQALRQAAETAAAQTNSEIEELTGQLFQQANEMVATERKVRARLEERVEVLERRDGEKARRLGVLERRVLRVERVRNLLEKDREGG